MKSRLLPNEVEYRRAFEQVRPHLTELQWNLLEAHFHAPGHIASAGELASVAGRDTYRATNAAYGGLGIRLRRALGRPRRHGEDQISILVGFWSRDDMHEFARLEMH